MRKLFLVFFVAGLFASCSDDVNNIDSNSNTPQQLPDLIRLANGMYVEKTDSSYLLEDDMLLTERQVHDICANSTRGAYRTGPTSNQFVFRWPLGKVYYQLTNNSTVNNKIQYAINHWQQNTCIRFYNSNGSGNYIQFAVSSGNNSYIGMTGGSQTINLTSNCSYRNAIHEIGHALGLFHEHSRLDRDSYVIINWSNIKPGKEHNFYKYNLNNYYGTDYGAFDFNSVMLYQSMITDPNFVYDTTVPTMTKLNGSTFGQSSTLSSSDIATINEMYGGKYSKIRTVITNDNSWSNGTGELQDYVEKYYIDFYTDSGKINAGPLLNATAFHINKYRRTIRWDTNLDETVLISSYNTTVQPGVSTYYVGDAQTYMLSEYGNDSGYYEYYVIN